MNIKITGKDLKATEAIKDYTEKKLERIQKYFDEEFNVNVTIRTEKNLQIAEMHVITKVEDEILKTVYYDIKPIAPEDAKMKLEEMGNAFMPFINIETGKVNVIFKLKDGKNYGLVEPEV